MFGLNKLHLAGYGLALAIIAYLIFNPRVEYVPIEYEEDKSLRDSTQVTETIIDTVFIKDTVEVSLDIPEPVSDPKEDSIDVYTTNYSDYFLTAKITSGVSGTLHYQNLWYQRKVRHIKTTTITTNTIDRYFKPTRVFEDPNRRNYTEIWGGLDVEDFGEGLSLTPNITYIRGNVAYKVGYNLNENSLQQFDLNALRVGVKFKIF